MDYKKIHDKIITNAIKNKDIIISDYHEKHHIVPKCMGGSDQSDNIVALTAKMHFTIHHLLCKIYPNDYKLSSAFNFMCCHTSNNRTFKVNSRLFEIARRNFSNNHPMKNEAIKNKSRNGLIKYFEKMGVRRAPKIRRELKNWGAVYDDMGVEHVDGYRICGECGEICISHKAMFCDKKCYDLYQSKNFQRSTKSHVKMVKNIKKHIESLSPEDKKNRLANSIHSDNVDHIERGRKISAAKKGKSTNQYEIMGRRHADMSDEEFEKYLTTISPKTITRMINLRNKWKKILLLEN